MYRRCKIRREPCVWILSPDTNGPSIPGLSPCKFRFKPQLGWFLLCIEPTIYRCLEEPLTFESRDQIHATESYPISGGNSAALTVWDPLLENPLGEPLGSTQGYLFRGKNHRCMVHLKVSERIVIYVGSWLKCFKLSPFYDGCWFQMPTGGFNTRREKKPLKPRRLRLSTPHVGLREEVLDVLRWVSIRCF